MPDLAEVEVKVGKILRGCRAMWGSFDKENWTLLGKDDDDLSIDLNPDTEQKKNVLGETTTENNGYKPSISPSYIARREDAIYPHLQEIVDTLTTDENKTTMYMMVATLTDEVKDSDTKTLTGRGYMVKTQVVVNNDGGGTNGYTIPFTASEDGGRIQGSVSVTKRVPTFTEDDDTSVSTPATVSTQSTGKETSSK